MTRTRKRQRQNRRARLMAGHIRSWRKSGLSQNAYSKRMGINISTFGYWKKKLGQPNDTGAKFVEVTANAASPNAHFLPALVEPGGNAVTGLRVELGAGRFKVEVPDGFNAETLSRLISTLECS